MFLLKVRSRIFFLKCQHIVGKKFYGENTKTTSTKLKKETKESNKEKDIAKKVRTQHSSNQRSKKHSHHNNDLDEAFSSEGVDAINIKNSEATDIVDNNVEIEDEILGNNQRTNEIKQNKDTNILSEVKDDVN